MTWDRRRDGPPPGTRTLPPGPLPVAVSGVSWRHDGIRGVHDLSFTLAPGRHLGVVGPSGAGNSTLAALLALLIEPEAGTIRLGDAAISQLNPADVRRRVAYLPQTPALFAASLLDNLTMFDRTIPPDRTVEAPVAVGLAPWTDRLAHPVDRSALSAGERELLALAGLDGEPRTGGVGRAVEPVGPHRPSPSGSHLGAPASGSNGDHRHTPHHDAQYQLFWCEFRQL